MSKCRSKSHNTLRNFLCDNRLQQLEVVAKRAKRVSAYTLPTIFPICKRNFLSVKAVILISLVLVAFSASINAKTSEF